MEKTITSIFIRATLNISRNELTENGYINSFIRDDIFQTKYEDCVYLLFRPKYISRFRKFVNTEYERTKLIIADYDHKNGFVVLVYKLNPKFINDYLLVTQSKYSKTSKEFQEQFPEYIEFKKNGITTKEYSLQYRVFNKTPELRQYWKEKDLFSNDKREELWYNFNEASETLTDESLNDLFFNNQ